MGDKKDIGNTYIQEEGMENLWNFWYSELHKGVSGLTLKIDRVLESTQSEYQRIDVLQNKDFGKLLALYGSLMVCDNDNNAYNEMLAHVPLFVHPHPKNILIIGGGDCGTLTEVLKHPEVERCTMCELDEMVVETARKHFPKLTAGLDDPRANVVFEDGKKFVAEAKEKFDVILLDLSDPIGPAADLFQREFYQQVFDLLKRDGILVPQTESPFFNKETMTSLYRNLADLFPITRLYTCFMPIYPSGYWSFVFASKKYDPIDNFDEPKYNRLSLSSQYYNAETHKAAFALPQFVKELLG